MKIIFDNIVFSLQKAGGISVVWQELISRFLKTNHEVLFLEHETDKNNIFRQKLILPDKSIIKERNLFLKITRYLSPSVDFQDTFIFHSSYFRTCNNKNAINVTTVHDFTYEYFYKGKRRGAFLHLWQRNRAILRSDAIICISENTKKDLLKFLPQVDSRKIHVINNGVSSDYHIIGEDYRYKQYAGWLLFVGHRVAYKNGEFFARSIKNTNYKVVFCGPKMSDDEIMLYDSILGRDRYITVSQISNEELNIYYNSCLCLSLMGLSNQV